MVSRPARVSNAKWCSADRDREILAMKNRYERKLKDEHESSLRLKVRAGGEREGGGGEWDGG